MFCPWGQVSTALLAGRPCCIDDAVLQLVFGLFTLLVLWSQIVADLFGLIKTWTFFCGAFLKFLKSWSECGSREYCFNMIYITFLLLTIQRRHDYCDIINYFISLWSARYLGWKVDVVWFLIKTSCPIFKSDALLNFLSSSGSLLCLELQSSSTCSFHTHLS